MQTIKTNLTQATQKRTFLFGAFLACVFALSSISSVSQAEASQASNKVQQARKFIKIYNRELKYWRGKNKKFIRMYRANRSLLKKLKKSERRAKNKGQKWYINRKIRHHVGKRNEIKKKLSYIKAKINKYKKALRKYRRVLRRRGR